MPYVSNDGVRIHYQMEGAGPPLVLHHGVAASLKRWYQCGYVEALRDRYRLILIDARGHGQSDKPHDRASYAQERRVADVLAVLDDINMERVHFFGYSMGARAGFALAKHAPERIHSLVLGGMHPYGLVQDRDVFPDTLETNPLLLTRFGRGRWAAGPVRRAVGRQVIYPLWRWKQRLVNHNDPDAVLACAATLATEGGFEDALPGMTMPTLIFVGELDGAGRPALAEQGAREMPNATFVMLPGLDHERGLSDRDAVLPHVIPFLEAAVEQTRATT
ncbi:MAG: alpha/beta fold hydrolase [Armatimonadetes bacterium]|nr:alpha/beta fold hydrolase [Armatimonadota bacterium]